MSTFEESLERVLDPKGLYWRYPGDEDDESSRARLIEVRLDVALASVATARSIMEEDGWEMESQPDEASDPIQRLFFRKSVDLLEQSKIAMLTASLKAAHAGGGKFWSWINVEDLGEE